MQDGLGTEGGEKLSLVQKRKARKRVEEAMWVEVRRIFKEGKGGGSAMQDLLKSGKQTRLYSVPDNFHLAAPSRFLAAYHNSSLLRQKLYLVYSGDTFAE